VPLAQARSFGHVLQCDVRVQMGFYKIYALLDTLEVAHGGCCAQAVAKKPVIATSFPSLL